MTLPDYSEYLDKPQMLEWIEAEWIAKPEMHEEHARLINDFVRQRDLVKKYEIRSVIEFGCGSGEVAKRLDAKLNYLGCDNNGGVLKVAREKNDVDKMFEKFDIRTFDLGNYWDLVFAFAFLKHFGLHEWSQIFSKLASLGKFLIFDMPITVQTKDDGIEYHHVWMSEKDILKNIEDIGFEVLGINYSNSIEPVFVCKRKDL